MSLVIGNTLLFVCIIIELLLMRYSKESIPWKEIIVNINSGHILMWIFRSLAISAYQLSLDYFSLHLIDSWPYVAQWIFGFFAWDFCFYWSHRFHHKYPALWAVHVVHHEGEHFNLSLGVRNSWYSSVTSFPFFFVLTLVGLPLQIFVIVSGIHYFVQFYNHNHFIKKSGWLEYIMVTPSHHRVHHGKNDVYIDKNFGGTFVFWDKLFKSFQKEKEDVQVQFGVNDPSSTANFILLNNIPFLKLFGKYRKRQGTKMNSFVIPTYVNIMATSLLICLLLCFIRLENSIALEEKTMLFFITFLGTIGVGGMSENKLWGLLTWIFSSLVLSIAILMSYPSIFPLLKLTLLLCLVQGVLLLGTIFFSSSFKKNIL